MAKLAVIATCCLLAASCAPKVQSGDICMGPPKNVVELAALPMNTPQEREGAGRLKTGACIQRWAYRLGSAGSAETVARGVMAACEGAVVAWSRAEAEVFYEGADRVDAYAEILKSKQGDAREQAIFYALQDKAAPGGCPTS